MSRFRGTFRSLAVVAVLSVSVTAAHAGSISGTITGPGRDAYASVYNASGDRVGWAGVDGVGAYSVTGLAPGRYFVRTGNSSGYIDQLHEGLTCVGFCNVQLGQAVTVGSGDTPGINFALVPGARISGVVRDSDGAELEGISVRIVDAGNFDVSSGWTNAAGEYMGGAGLPTGSYYVRTSNANGYINELYPGVPCLLDVCPTTSATALMVTAGEVRSGIDFTLRPGGRFAGTVTDGVAPIPNVRIDVLNAAGQRVSSSGWTDAAGRFATDRGVPRGSYFVKTSNDLGYINRFNDGTVCVGNNCSVATLTPLAAAEGETTMGVAFTLSRGGRIGGTVRDADGGSLRGISVDILSSSGSLLTSSSTDATGSYLSREGLPAGSYYVRTWNDDGYLNELYNDVTCAAGCNVVLGAPVVVAAGDTTSGIDFVLAAGGRVSGVIRNAATLAPLSRITVSVHNAVGTSLSSGTTDSTGRYITGAGMVAGRYSVRTANGQGYINEVFPDSPCVGTSCPSGGTPVAVSLVGIATADMELQEGGRIGASVMADSTGAEAVPGAIVSILDSSGRSLNSGTVDALGHYVTGAGLPVGTYYARASNNVGYMNELYDDVPCQLGCNVTGGAGIRVHALGTTTSGIDFRLAAGGRITGRVTAEGGGALANVAVFVSSAAGGSVSATTDSNGVYDVSGLPTGSYYLRTSNAQGYINEVYDDVRCASGCSASVGLPQRVTAPETLAGIDFVLTRGGRVSGTVTHEGLPVAGVTVSILDGTGAFLSSGTTDLSGRYVTGAGLVTGRYRAQTSNGLGYFNELYDNIRCSGGCDVALGASFLVDGPETRNINFDLDRGARVSGTVTSGGTPLPNVSVSVHDATGRFVSSGFTDAAGVYITREGLPEGRYYARTSNSQGYIDELYDDKPCPAGCPIVAGMRFDVAGTDVRVGVDFALDPGGRISGAVTDEHGDPLSGVTVDVYDETGRFMTSGLTDNFGRYITQAGLPTGRYFARTFNSSGYINELFGGAACVAGCLVTSGTPIAVTSPEPTSGRDFMLRPGARVSGTITAGGRPVSRVSVQVYDTSSRVASTGTTNALGQYQTSAGLPDGSYFLRTSNSQGLVNQLYRGRTCIGSCDVTAGTPIMATASVPISGIDIDLVAGGRISGRITREGATTPLPGVRVAVYDSTGARVASGEADGEGRYVTGEGLPEGSYYVRTENSQGLVDEVYDNRPCATSCVPTSGERVAVGPDTTREGVDFALAPDDDVDGDGIARTIDTSPAFSHEFSDAPLGGATAGTIAARNGWSVTVGDVSPGGVQLALTGSGAGAAAIDGCMTGGAERVQLDAPGEIASLLCGSSGTTFVRAVVAAPAIEVREPPVGAGIVVSLTTGQSVSLGSPVTADASNTEIVTVRFVDAAGATFGTFELDPGESVDAEVQADGGVETAVLAGIVTIAVRGESVRLNPGESHRFGSPDPSPQQIIDGLIAKVRHFMTTGDIRRRSVGLGLVAQLQTTRRLIARHRRAACVLICGLVREVESL